jgi:hypothetical protein
MSYPSFDGLTQALPLRILDEIRYRLNPGLVGPPMPEGVDMSASQDGYPPPEPAASPENAARAYRVRLTKVSSFIVVTQQRHAVYTGTLEQLESAARSVRTHNLLLGWWGLPFGLVWTPMALSRNAKAIQQARSLAAQHGPEPAAASGSG